MRDVLAFLKPYRRHLIAGPAFKLTEAVLELLLPLLIAHMIDVGIAQSDTALIWRYGLICLALALTGLGCATVCQYAASLASQGYGTDLRRALFHKISHMRQKDIDSIGSSSLINRLNSDINILQQAVAMLIRLVVRAPFLSIGGLIMAMTLNFELSLILLVTLPLFIIIIYLIMSRTIPLYRKTQSILDHLTRKILENLSGVRVIRAFAQNKSERVKFRQDNDQLAAQLVKVGRIAGFLNPATTLVLNGAIIAVLWFGAVKIEAGQLTRGQMIALTNYIGQILIALVVVANLVILYSRAYASAQRVGEVLQVMPKKEKAKKAKEARNSDEWLVVDNVTFRYPDNSEPLFRNISFSLPGGNTVGIIGPTGAGKSTLAWLLLQIWSYEAGSIRLEGREISAYSSGELKQKISIVPQKAVLFSGSIADNLRLGCPEATDEDLWQALEIAQASEFVKKLDAGLDSILPRGGSSLSGGQRQRLTIARALVCRPELLILDDSTSALDYATDAALRQAIRTSPRLRGMSSLIISQRVNAVRHADIILVLDEGKISGIGDHNLLMRENRLYREFWQSQSANGETRRTVD